MMAVTIDNRFDPAESETSRAQEDDRPVRNRLELEARAYGDSYIRCGERRITGHVCKP